MSEKDMETNNNNSSCSENIRNNEGVGEVTGTGSTNNFGEMSDNTSSFGGAAEAPVDYSIASGQKEYVGNSSGQSSNVNESWSGQNLNVNGQPGVTADTGYAGAQYSDQNVCGQASESAGAGYAGTGYSDQNVCGQSSESAGAGYAGAGYGDQNVCGQASESAGAGYAGAGYAGAGYAGAEYTSAGYGDQNAYAQPDGAAGSGFGGQYAGGQYTYYQTDATQSAADSQKKKKKEKKPRKPMKSGTKKVISVVVAVVLAFAAGFGGGALAINTFGSGSGSGSYSGKVTEKTVSIDSTESQMDAASAIAEKVMPSVVGISTVTQVYTQSIFGLQQGTAEGSGTGFIVDSNGYILTNAHVVEDSSSSQITVDLYDGTEKEGTVLWSDSSLDLAIVKIDATGLQAVEIGDSDDVKIGDYALAIGNPLGKDFERSVTQGIISGLNRSITTTDGSTTNNMEGLIQTDASINSGNSGGPLIDSEGKVIGINSAKASSAEGLGFAIPINTAVPIINEIKEEGTYEQAYIGIAGMDMATVNQYYETEVKAEEGVYVTQIYTGSPAATAGVTEGDVIVKMNGEDVDTMSNLKKMLVKCRPGDEITLTIERNQKEQEIKVTLGKSSESTSGMKYKTQSSSGTTDDGSGSYSYGNDGSGSYSYGSDGSSGSSGSNGSSGSSGSNGSSGSSGSFSDFFSGMFGN